MSHTDYWEEISELAQRATAAREEFVPPEDPPDERRATELLREGLGPTIMVYVDARTGEWTRFPPVEHSLLERTLNDFLELYARCFGYEIDAEFTVREAAETLIETNNVRDTAQLLTGVPSREEMPDAWSGERTD